MKSSVYFHRQAGEFGAFTQVELLVLLMVIGMLAMIGLSASAKLNNQTKIAQCSNNLRQFNLAHLLYAADNSDMLPRDNGVAQWPWDVSIPVAEALLRNGVTTNAMYCPGTAPRFTDEQNFAAANSLWNFGGTGPSGFHIIGYSMSMNGKVASTNQNFTITPQPVTVGSSVILPQPSQRVLTADAILSQGENSSFAVIYGGFTQNGVSYPHLSPHLDGQFPAGCNVGMLDGHVEWRPFKQMQIRTPLGSPPYFYW